MAMKPLLQSLPLALCLLLLLLGPSSAASPDTDDYDLSDFNRTSFPAGFLFGTAIAAYQFEGAVKEGGRGPSIWDFYTHKYPEKILDHTNGDVAVDMYHRYKDDIKLLKSLNVDAFRMSISWTRILPGGKLSGGVNQAGVDFYNNFINELLANGITPFVTIFHWDLPLALENEYKGFLSRRIVDDYKDFAEVCFQKFGDRVKNWMTFNEPFTFTSGGYDGGFIGHLAPGRCTPPECPTGNSATEPYIVAHNLLLAHAATVKLYREKYQATQKGKIGIVLVTHWFVPKNASNPHDVVAARRTLDFVYGWFIDPVVYGRYPKSMEYYVGNRLPKFTPQESALLKGSFDFLGVNYYTGNYAAHLHSRNHIVTSTSDKNANLTTAINGVNIGKPTGVDIFFVYPSGLRELLIYTKKNYKDPTIYITENGMGDVAGTSWEESTNDPQRIDFYNGHLKAVQDAIKNGVKVKGYFAWTYMDGWEWGSGFMQRFGLVYVDFKNGLKRIPKKSALWVRKCLSIK